MIADCWRPSGYLASWRFAQARLSALKTKVFGWTSGGARRRTDISSFHGLAIFGGDGRRARRLRDEAEEQPALVLQEDAGPDRAGDRTDGREALREQALHGLALMRRGRACGQHKQRAGDDCAAHRSTSPNTMSMEPRMAETSASMWPRVRKSMAWRCAKPGALILHLYGLLLPSATR